MNARSESGFLTWYIFQVIERRSGGLINTIIKTWITEMEVKSDQI